MVNTGLDRKYVAKEGGQTNFDPIPEGDYRLKVKDIDPWKEAIKTIKATSNNNTPREINNPGTVNNQLIKPFFSI